MMEMVPKISVETALSCPRAQEQVTTMIMAQVRLKMQFVVFTEGEQWDEPLLAMAGDLLLHALQATAEVHLDPVNRGQFMSAADGADHNRRMLEEQQDVDWEEEQQAVVCEGKLRVAVVAVWQDRVVVLQRGEVVIMPGAAIEVGEPPIKGAARALWEMAGILVSVNSCFEVEDTHDLRSCVSSTSKHREQFRDFIVP